MREKSILLAQKVLEVSDRVGRIPHKEVFRLTAIVFVAIDIGKNRRYLTI